MRVKYIQAKPDIERFNSSPTYLLIGPNLGRKPIRKLAGQPMNNPTQAQEMDG